MCDKVVCGFVKDDKIAQDRPLQLCFCSQADFALSNSESGQNHAPYLTCAVMISDAIAHTHHTLLAEAEELLDFLRHEHLGTANCISDQLEHWGGNSTRVLLEIQELFIICLYLSSF